MDLILQVNRGTHIKLKPYKIGTKVKLKISCSNIRGLNNNAKTQIKMQHINQHLDSTIKIVVDAHADNTIDQLRK